MKISYIAPLVGACALLAFSSCRSTDADGYAETAVPMSEMEIGDGQIPPWLLDDDGSNGSQVSAGTHTPSMAAHSADYTYAGQRSGRGSSRQNQPKLANTDDTIIEEDPLLNVPQYTPPSHSVSHTATHTPKRTSSTSSRPKRPTMVTYKVRPGDSLSLIAARSNTTVSQIMKDSKLKSTLIRPGQTIKVRYTPKGAKSGKGSAGSKGKGSRAGASRTHTVTSGQTLSGIASRYGVSTSALMKANGLNQTSARKLRPGTKLKVPSKR